MVANPSYRPRRGLIAAALRGRLITIVGANPPPEPPPPSQERAHPFSSYVPAEADKLWVSTSGSDTTGNGTSTNPYRTIQHAIGAISGSRRAVFVRAGTYNEHINLGGRHGTLANPIMLKSADGNGQVLITPPTTGNDTVKANSVEYFWIDGIRVTCPLNTGWNGIKATRDGSGWSGNLARYIVITHCEVFCPTGSGDGIKIGAGAEFVYIHYNEVFGQGGSGPEQGIDLVATNNFEIFGNDVYLIGGSACVQAKGGSTTGLIASNKVHNCPSTSVDGIHLGGGTDASSFRPGFDTYEAKDVTIENNEIFDIGKRGVWFMGPRDSTFQQNNTYNCGGRDCDLLESPLGFDCINISILSNTWDNTNWNFVGVGQGSGLVVTGNSPNDDAS